MWYGLTLADPLENREILEYSFAGGFSLADDKFQV